MWGGERQLAQGVKGNGRGKGGGDEANRRIKLISEILLATCTCMVL